MASYPSPKLLEFNLFSPSCNLFSKEMDKSSEWNGLKKDKISRDSRGGWALPLTYPTDPSSSAEASWYAAPQGLFPEGCSETCLQPGTTQLPNFLKVSWVSLFSHQCYPCSLNNFPTLWHAAPSFQRHLPCLPYLPAPPDQLPSLPGWAPCSPVSQNGVARFVAPPYWSTAKGVCVAVQSSFSLALWDDSNTLQQ